MPVPVLTLKEHQALLAARDAARPEAEVSLDLDRSRTTVAVSSDGWSLAGERYPFLEVCKENTVYYWTGTEFEIAARFAKSLIKLVPTEWGPPTFQIDGIKMLPTAKVCPFEDARRKVALIEPKGKVVLDCCGGLGYFASWCLEGQARRIHSFEVSPDVVWLRGLNPWSPKVEPPLSLTLGDVGQEIVRFADGSVDAVLHDPPRFALAGDLYSQIFYDHLARVLKPGGRLFHYTGTPNMLTSGRNVPNEVSKRLQRAGFLTELVGDGVLAVRNARPKGRARGNR